MALDQLNLLDWTPPEPRGATYLPERDGARLSDQARRVLAVFMDHEWHTLRDISAKTGDPEASVSARKRDLCRAGFKIERAYVESGLHKYRLTKGATV